MSHSTTLLRQLTHFATVDPTISLPMMMTLTVMAEEIDRTGERWVRQEYIRDNMPVSSASVSRAVTYWSKHHDGKGFITTTQDPQDRRLSLLSFTPSGNMFVQGLFSRQEKNDEEDESKDA